MNKINNALSCFKNGYNCSQAIFSAYCEGLGIETSTALRIAAAFGGGMGRMGETCGAVTGALMVLGLKYADGKESKEKVYALVNAFASQFKTRNGSIVCRELLACDLGTPAGQKAYKENTMHVRCTKFVRDAAEIIETLVSTNKSDSAI